MRRTIKTLAAAALFFAAILPTANAADVATGSIDLATARQTALAVSETIKQAELAVRTARLGETSAVAEFLPSASANGGLSSPVGGSADFYVTPSVGVSVSQTLFSGGSRTAALKSASTSVKKAEAALASARLSVIADVDTRYLDALQTKKNYEAALVDLEAANKRLDLAKAKKAAGALAEDEFLSTQSTWASKNTAAVQAKYAAEASRRKLASLLKTDAAPVPLDDASFLPLLAAIQPLAAADLDGLVQKLYRAAQASNPDLLQKELAAEVADLSIGAKKAAFLPSVSASFSYKGSKPDGADYAGNSTASVSASIPIFPLIGTAASVSTAKAEAQSVRSQLSAAQEDLSLSFYTTTLDLLSAAGRIESADAAVSYAEQNHKMVLEKVRLSILAIGDLSDAEATLTTARKEAISARFDLYTSAMALARLLGQDEISAILDALK